MECALASSLERCDECLVLRLRNTSKAHNLMWKVKTNHRLRYLFRPTQGIIPPDREATCDVFEDDVHPTTPKDKLLVLSCAVDAVMGNEELTSLWHEKQRLHKPKSMRLMFSETKIKCPRPVATNPQSVIPENPVSKAHLNLLHVPESGQHDNKGSTRDEATAAGCRSTSFVSVVGSESSSLPKRSDTSQNRDERDVFVSPQKACGRDSVRTLSAMLPTSPPSNGQRGPAVNAANGEDVVNFDTISYQSGRERAATVSIPLKVPLIATAISLNKPRSRSSPLPNAQCIELKHPSANRLSPTGRWSHSSQNIDFRREHEAAKVGCEQDALHLSPLSSSNGNSDDEIKETEGQRRIRERVSKVLESHDGRGVYEDDEEEDEEENLNDALYGVGVREKPSKDWTKTRLARLSLDTVTNQKIPASGDEQYRQLLEYVTKLSHENQRYKATLDQQERRNHELRAQIEGLRGEERALDSKSANAIDEDPWSFSRRVGKETAERAQFAMRRFSEIFNDSTSMGAAGDFMIAPRSRSNGRRPSTPHARHKPATPKDFVVIALGLAFCVCVLTYVCGGMLRIVW